VTGRDPRLLRSRLFFAAGLALAAVFLLRWIAPRQSPAPVSPSFEPPAAPADEPAGDPPSWVGELRGRRLLFPVRGDGVEPLRDTFDDPRGGRRHEALDIMAPRHAPVVAVEDGRVARLFLSAGGGVTLYQFDPSERYCYYYAHLDRYARGLREGDAVERGQVLGYVGTTGNAPASAPHLHFAIFRLGADKRWWEGEALNPYLVLGG
jgi:murein DD-endopeptidase MepM/ murein hydrolase activator NlpD